MEKGELIRAETFYKHGEIRRILDFIVIPPAIDERKLHEALNLVRPTRTIVQLLPYDMRANLSHISHDELCEILYKEYMRQFAEHGHEPKWALHMPNLIRMYVRRRRLMEMNNLEWFALSLAGIDYAYNSDGLTARTVDLFSLQRLRNVHQYGYLNQRETRNAPHSRFHHSMHVGVIAALISFNNRNVLSTNERVILRIAALTHDVATPAGGDATKQLVPALDEDAQYTSIIERIPIDNLFRNAHYARKGIIGAVQGKGVCGALLDISDKIAYVALDAYMECARIYTYLHESLIQPIATLLEAHPRPCSLWEDVCVKDKKAVFANAERLVVFLKLRALMFKYCYFNSAEKQTWMPTMTVGRLLIQSGRISETALQCMNDPELLYEIEKSLERKWWNGDGRTIGDTKTECFATKDEAKTRECELIQQGVGFCFVESLSAEYHGITSPLETFHVQNGNEIGILEEMLPTEAEEIRALAHEPCPYRVHYMSNPNVGKKVAKKMLAFRKQECGII